VVGGAVVCGGVVCGVAGGVATTGGGWTGVTVCCGVWTG
jgi:hypothetical protein